MVFEKISKIEGERKEIIKENETRKVFEWMKEWNKKNREKIKNWIFLFMGLLKVCNILD